MTGTIRFDDDHIVKFELNTEDMELYLFVKIEDNVYTPTVSLSGGDDEPI